MRSETRNRRKAFAQDVVALQEAVEKRGGKWSNEDQRRFDDLTAEVERLDRIGKMESQIDSGEADRWDSDGFGGGAISLSVPSHIRNTYGKNQSIYEARRDTFDFKNGDELSMGEYLRAMARGPQCELEERALSEGTDGAGGFTVPDSLSARWIDNLRHRMVLVRAGAQSMVLDSDSNSIAKLATDPSFSWAAEGTTAGSTDPTFDRLLLEPKTHRGLFKVSRELIQDGLNTEPMLERAFNSAMAREIQRAALVGASTSGGPEGLYESTSVGSQSVAGSTAGVITWLDLADGWQTLAESGVDLDRVSSIMSPRTYKELSVLRAGTSNVWLNKPGLLSNLGMYATGAIGNSISVGATTGCSWIGLGNFGSMILGFRLRPTIEILKERFAGEFSYGFLVAMRMDVGWEHDADFIRITNIKATT